MNEWIDPEFAEYSQSEEFKRSHPNGPTDERWWVPYGETEPSIELKIVNGRDLATKSAPEREWEIVDLIPAARVTGFSGDGAGGKSLSAMQLGVAQTTGTGWFGKLPRKGKCLIVSCEDDADECHRRVRDIIAGREDIDPEDLANLEIIDMVGEDALLASLDPRSHAVIPTALYGKIVEYLGKFFGEYVKGSNEGRILILDTLAKVYGGDENVSDAVCWISR